uniref:Uncharacterized protein AlNc14C40G3445 n=1 Tax=Albugo laibachii Nc14 TaxID=890382 RepID=F0W9I6_9STRA|nr:conserved hypothetical protein [Albugo laibachii Nc14]|eukprot:CCA17800.1 conserved hypothetical protein [Albugo laibachii Nc14]
MRGFSANPNTVRALVLNMGSDRFEEAAKDEEYFPSFLTASAEKPQETKSSPHTASSSFQHAKVSNPSRYTFNDSLLFDSKKSGVSSYTNEIEDSPFNYLNNYKKRSTEAAFDLRHRKDNTYNKTEAAKSIDEDDLPPTRSLTTSSDFAPNVFSGSDSWSPMPNKIPSSLHPLVQGDAWGIDGQYWVTVFGFPVASKVMILTYFGNVGELVDTRDYGGKANWIHIRYRTCLQAEKALSSDGSMIGGFMVGVKKCYSTGIDSSCSAYPSNSSQFTHTQTNEYDVIDSSDADIFLPPRRRKDICSRIAHYLFNW